MNNASSKIRKPKAFVSYARNDHQAAVRLTEELRTAGADPWLDTEKLIPGQNWKDAVHRAMEEADFFVALISKESVAKAGYVQKELKDALEILDRLPPSRIYVIPTRLDDSIPAYKILHDIHWVDLFPTWEIGFRRLALAMGLQPAKVWEPDQLDIYIRTNVDLSKFEWDDRWGDGYALVSVEYLGYDGLFVFWNERERLLEKWHRHGEIRWSGPERLTDQERAKVWKSLT